MSSFGYYRLQKEQMMSRLAARDGGWRCRYCGVSLKDPTNRPRQHQKNWKLPTIDHVIPLSKGGADTEENMVLACNGYEDSAVAARADIRFLRPTRLGDTLTAIATEKARGGRSGIYDVTVRNGDAVVAEFRGDSRTITR